MMLRIFATVLVFSALPMLGWGQTNQFTPGGGIHPPPPPHQLYPPATPEGGAPIHWPEPAPPTYTPPPQVITAPSLGSPVVIVEEAPSTATPPMPEVAPMGQEAQPDIAGQLEALSKRLTVLTVTEDVKIILGGAITADFLYNSARPVGPGTPFFLAPDSQFGFEQDTFDAHARQTALYAIISGPEVCGFESGGFILVNLYNDSIIADRYGLLPIQAFGQLKNDEWRFAAGLQYDIFNPVLPTVLPFSYLVGSGNSGNDFRGQARVERYFYPSPGSQVTLIAGISEPIATSISRDFELSEDNGWPNVEGRAALGLGPIVGEGPLARRPFELGVSGVIGQLRTTNFATGERVVADVWGLGVDLRWAITERFGIQGEVFTGDALGTYDAAILQTVNALTFDGIRASGGWLEVYYYLLPESLHAHVGYGIDDPLDRDLAPFQRVRNETYFANLILDVTRYFRVAWEFTYRETSYKVLRDNDGVGFHTQFQWKF